MGGAKAAHRWTKVPERWQSKQVFRSGKWTGMPGDLLHVEAERLGQAWGAQDRAPSHWQLGPVQAQPITPQQVYWASRSFSGGTSSTFDGLHVKHYSMVGMGTEQVASLLSAIVELGEMPHSILCVVYGLAFKHKPGKVAHSGIAVDVQTAFLSSAASWAGGGSRATSLLLCGDPSWRAAMAPFLQ